MQVKKNQATEPAPVYALGHSEKELQRLIDQSHFFSELTEEFLNQAGLRPGMSVLDLGCGAGDISFRAARLVGTGGRVLGVDKSAVVVALAQRRAKEMNLKNVEFIEGDATSLSLKEPFDAVLGRFILMYMPDAAAALRRVTNYVRPGGLVAFQELDFTNIPTSQPRSELYEQMGAWGVETLRRSGAETQMGLKLPRIFREAGLPAPQLTFGARVEGGEDSPAYEYLAETLRSLLPMAEAFGIVTEQEAGIDTFAERLRTEVVSLGGVILMPYLVGACARKAEAI